MIDYIKTVVTKPIQDDLRANPNLEFTSVVNIKTGEIKGTYERAKYYGLEFRLFKSGTTHLLGSIHKFWNAGKHNFNDFYWDNVKQVFVEIENLFGIRPEDLKINFSEFGVNLIPPIPSYSILRKTFFHGRLRFLWGKVPNGGRFLSAEHSQSECKFYDKGRQHESECQIKGDLLRFEVRVKKLEKIKHLQITTCKDLLQTNPMDLIQFLLDEWNKVLLYDPTIKSDDKRLKNYSNSDYWSGLIESRSYSTWKKHKRALKELTENYSDNIHLQIATLIKSKGLLLSQGTCFDHDCNRSEPIKGTFFDQQFTPSKNEKGTAFDHSSIRSIKVLNTKPRRTCIVTGLDISMQNYKSRFLSAVGVRYYYYRAPAIYYQLLYPRLTERMKQGPLEKQFEEIAHRVRGAHHDKRRSALRSINRHIGPNAHPSLFEPISLMSRKKLTLAGYLDSPGNEITRTGT